jgi:hypothetical protein
MTNTPPWRGVFQEGLEALQRGQNDSTIETFGFAMVRPQGTIVKYRFQSTQKLLIKENF